MMAIEWGSPAHRAVVAEAEVARLSDLLALQSAALDRVSVENAELRKAGPWTTTHVEKQRAMRRERDGDCICDTNPETTDGPDECCPWHGRAYAEWIERGDVLATKRDALAATVARVEALLLCPVHGVAECNPATHVPVRDLLAVLAGGQDES